jgi:hypothetical protein
VLEPIRVRPAYHLTHALHAALAVVGSVVSVYVPPLGVAILLLVAVSMFGDLTARFHLFRRLMPRRSSQNVTSPGSPLDAPARLVLTAHYDAARSGLIFNRRRRPPPRLLRRLRNLAGPIDLVFWTVIVALALALARLIAGFSAVEATPVTVAQFVATALLLVAVTLFIDVALSEVVPGANDNASGVAAVLEVGRRLTAQPPANLDVWLVFTGAQEGLMLGMREWMRAHDEELDPRRTVFVNVDSVGSGTVRFVGAEGFVILYQHDLRLVRLSESIARSGDRDEVDPKPHILRLGTDGVLPPMRGFSSITICCTDEHGRIPAYHRQFDTADRIDQQAVGRAIEFVEELVRQIDHELVPSMLPSLELSQAAAAPGATSAERAPTGPDSSG